MPLGRQISCESVLSHPCAGENIDFWPESKLSTCSLPLHGILPVKTYKHYIFEPTASAHCMIFPKLCVVTELVEAIKKDVNHF